MPHACCAGWQSGISMLGRPGLAPFHRPLPAEYVLSKGDERTAKDDRRRSSGGGDERPKQLQQFGQVWADSAAGWLPAGSGLQVEREQASPHISKPFCFGHWRAWLACIAPWDRRMSAPSMDGW